MTPKPIILDFGSAELLLKSQEKHKHPFKTSMGLQWGKMGVNNLGELLVFLSFLIIYVMVFWGFQFFQSG